jgi:hypothetical protein
MILLIMIIALVIVITQSASTKYCKRTTCLPYPQPQTHSYFINDRKVSKQEFDNSFKTYFN